MVSFLLACGIVLGGGLLVFIVLIFKARPERWTFKSFCLWLASLVSWCCFPPLYVWMERKWRRASWKRCSYALLSPVSLLFLVVACTFDPHRFIHNLDILIIDLDSINGVWAGIDALLSLISLIYLVYICSLVCKCVNKPYRSRMEISNKVGIELPAYEVTGRSYGNTGFNGGYTHEIDVRFDQGSETEKLYQRIRANPPAHWSVSEDGGFYFNEILEGDTFFTMRIDPQKDTANIRYGAW